MTALDVAQWTPRSDPEFPEPAPEPEPFSPKHPWPSAPQSCEIPDAMECEAEAAYRIGNGAAADYACGRHRWEAVAAHYRLEPNLPIYELDEGNGHACNEIRKTFGGAE